MNVKYKPETMFSIALVLPILFLLSLTTCKCKDNSKDNLMGIKTIHTQIDKDSVISRNMFDKKNQGKNGHKNNDDLSWSYRSFPSDVKNHVAQFKQNMTECLKEVQMNDKRTVKPLSPKRESPVHEECLIACVLKRNGVIKNGKIFKENLLSLVNKFFAKDDKLMKKLEKGLDRCLDSSSRTKDECKIAARLNDCTNELIAYNKKKL